MHTPFTDSYDKTALDNAMMGPNAMRVMEELTSTLALTSGMRVLDLGCGMGLSSILLAQKYGVQLVAADLWIAPTDNAGRFAAAGLEDRILPLSLDATHDIPFAHEYFDAIVSVDAYHYFGDNETMLPKILPFLKTGGVLAVAVPGFVEPVSSQNLPEALQPYWTPDWHFYNPSWWRALWEKEPGIRLETCREMDCFTQAWEEWLHSSGSFGSYSEHDRGWMDAAGWKYTNLIQVIARKNTL